MSGDISVVCVPGSAMCSCTIFAFEGQNAEKKDFLREMLLTCILKYCGAGPSSYHAYHITHVRLLSSEKP